MNQDTHNPLYVTQPFLPPLQEFIPYLEGMWSRKVLTNGGPLHQQLEDALCDYLGVKHLSLFTNGTVALVTALQALGVSGEVITTPYSFVATAHSLLWNGIQPVFVDIDPATLNLDPAKIEAAITPRTSAILPVHVYGTPCASAAIEDIAKRHGLKVIYDAAHAFGVKDHKGSVLNHGDLSVLSFHATKVFHTFEGGAIISPDRATKQHIDHLKNFGFVDEVTVVEPGINGKMSEVCAAMGLLQLTHIGAAIDKRRSLVERYRAELGDLGVLRCLEPAPGWAPNYAYFPVFVDNSTSNRRDSLYQGLQDQGIFTRRYFYPLISDFPMYRELPSAQASNLPHASAASRSVLCLPLFSDMSMAQQERVIAAIRGWAAQA